MKTKHTLKYNTPIRKSRKLLFLTAPTLLAALLLAGANPALADEKHKSRDYDRYDRHDKYDNRHDEHRYDNNRNRRDKHRYDNNRNRHDKHRYDNNRNRHNKHRYDNNRNRHNKHRYDNNHRRYNNRNRYDNHNRYRTYENNRYTNRPGYYHEPYGNRRFEIPRMIIQTHRPRYKDYYHSRVYYEDHNHHHDIYRFPAYAEGRLTYRPYSYCEGQYFATGYFGANGPRFSIRFNF